ncbi:MAG: ribosome small subunit-dependent GTPase A [Bacilli bacterium]|nr:ribosome small subunit-dependent GTPase A [Bacilli bacterium]
MQGQIVKILSNLYFVNVNGKVYDCHSRGKFRNENITPTVGDYVNVDIENKYIMDILPRMNTLIRPFVSNIDQGLIVTSVKKPDFSTNLLDKLLVVMEYNNIKPIICLTKFDLLDKKEKKEINKYIKYYKKLGYKVFINNKLFQIKKIFKGKTTVFTGQTGAGKSTLLNKLDSRLNLETGEISIALGRGKHTTRHVELIELFKGKLLDTPGFSSIDFSDLSNDNIKNSFIEFRKYNCKFSDCSHTNEKECEVIKATKKDELLAERHGNYLKFLQRK